MKTKKTIINSLGYVGAAICEGQTVRGVEKSPDLMRASGILGKITSDYKYVKQIKDYGNIFLLEEERKRSPVIHPVKNLNMLDPLLNRLSNTIAKASQENDLVVTVGGDHSVGSASISAMMSVHQKLKVVWVDAHADFVDPDSKGNPYQNYHGLPLSHITGVAKLPNFQWIKKLLPFADVVLIGIRDLDSDEWVSLKRHNVKCYTMDHVDQLGIGKVMDETLHYLDPNGDCPFHISFDIDSVDPEYVSQTGTRYRYGLTPRQSVHIVRRVAHERKLVGLDVVEINIQINKNQKRQNLRGEQQLAELSRTVGLGADLIESAFKNYFIL